MNSPFRGIMDQRKSVHIMHLPFIWLKLGELNPTIHLFETTKKKKVPRKFHKHGNMLNSRIFIEKAFPNDLGNNLRLY